MKEYKEKIALIDKKLDELLPKENTFPEILYKSIRYSVFSEGKRLRPLFLLLASKKTDEASLTFAAAIEMIHTYSLIHDDLPDMDDDDLRRGRKTNHIVFGNDIAILAGDALLNHAFEVISNLIVKTADTNYIKAFQLIAKASGASGMVAGQVADIKYSNLSSDEEKLIFIQEHKTSDLIRASIVAGAYLNNENETNIKKLSEVGREIGIAFQIQDDLLEETSSEDELGKPVDSDDKNLKLTAVSFYGIKKSEDMVNNYFNRSYKILDELNYPELRALIDKIRYRKK